ncbi:MAG: hypothetical protein A2Z77_09535 [Chloroflexi bacterium RBG_13_51_36]|nr:MAG: hypothetical protein A2Z77_09535 [Chloroflexi bacterium RBG_13_51_36]
MNLTEMRARVREDLQDTDSLNYRWTNDEVDGAIDRVVMEYSLQAPIQQQTDIATTDGDTELDISSLTGLIKIESVEFPIGESPKHLQHFDYWAGKLYMQGEGDGTDARVRWLKKHTLSADSTTIPAEHEEIIVLGATGYLAMSASANTVDRAFIAGRYGTISYKAWGIERLKRYDQQLRQIAQANRVVLRQLYTED